MEYKKELPLIVCKEIERLLKEVRSICHNYSNVVHFIEDRGFIIRINDNDKKSKFYFEIKSSKYVGEKVLFYFEYKPRDERSIEVQKATINYDTLMSYFNSWLQMLNNYNSISISPEDSVINFYEKEFLLHFDIVDEDADINPFDLEKQLILSRFIDSTILILKQNEVENEDEIITDLYELKDNQQNYTKRIVIQKLSIIFAKIRKRGIDLIKLVLKEASKELIKKAITEGMEFMGQIIVKL